MKSIIIRRMAPTALLAAVLLAVSPAAIAAPPEKGGNPPDFPEDTVVPAGEACDFPLLVEATGSNANIKVFRDEDGNIVRTITAGRGYTLTYSRLGPSGDPDEPLDSLTIRPTGSVQKVTFAPDGTQTVTATGSNGLILFSTDLPEEAAPSAIQYKGRIVYTISPENTFTLLSASGTSTDICAELAP
jgi:hypothetical protein